MRRRVCPTGTTAVGNDCQLPNSITNNLILPAGKKYIVSGQVSVQSGASLSIAPGVTVQGASVNTVANFIAVLQGGKIFAEGTATQPITFTGPTTEAGSWAGLVIAGRSTCNEATGATVPSKPCRASLRCNQLDDNSGRLRYVRIFTRVRSGARRRAERAHADGRGFGYANRIRAGRQRPG